jgi:hypothetical protein
VMARDGKILVLEHALTAGSGSDFTKLSDIGMFALTAGGRERTSREYQALGARAGLRLRRVVNAPSPLALRSPLRIFELGARDG